VILGVSFSGSGANFIQCMFLSGERLCGFQAAMTAAQISGAAAASPVSSVRLNCCFLIFSANWNAPNRHGRRLESVEPEHRPDPLLYSPVILLDHVV
jgi:hypothetical protein